MKIIRLLACVLGAGLLMGNQQCQPKSTNNSTPARELKKIVDIGLISSRPLEIPGNGNFDFQYVLNQQIYPVLQASNKFWFKYNPIFKDSQVPTTNAIDFSKMNISDSDKVILLEATKYTPPQVTFSDEISCFVNLPQVRIEGAVNSFEMKSKIGLSLGFTNMGSTNSSGIPHLGFDTETFQLDLVLSAMTPLTNKVLGSVDVTSKQTKTKVDFFVPFQNLLLSPSFYFQTPLSKVSYSALEKATAGISDQLKNQEWSARVLYDHESQITIIAGKNNNIQVGDVFDIYNEKAYWMSSNGEAVPCESQLTGTVAGNSVATIEIVEVGDDLSLGKVVKETGEPRKMGSLVKINKLKEATATTP